MKRICTLILAAGLVFGAATGASAIDFKAKGQWLMGFGVGTDSMVSKTRTGNDGKVKANNTDMFDAQQRVRLQLDAVASEALSGTVYFEIGTQKWGQSSTGGALGADGNNQVRVKNAYIDWAIPQTDAKIRMGIQGLALPNTIAGGSAVLDTDVAAVVGSYKFNENVGLTAFWARPFNDNYTGGDPRYSDRANYLDNMDLFGVMAPLTFDGVNLTPWVMYGMMGRNALTNGSNPNANPGSRDGNPPLTLLPYPVGTSIANADYVRLGGTSKSYGSMFWAGLPLAVTMFDPLNIELDINYGYVESMGRYDVQKGQGGDWVRGSTQRQGWLAKALVEYKMDWATPGLFGWYASGDDGSVKNGSERMPSIVPTGNMTSYMGDGNMGWLRQDYGVDYSGTWGIGAQLKDMSFLEDLKHTFRVAYWGGTNSTSMVKYMRNAYAWTEGYNSDNNSIMPYMTTNDGLVEFNLVNSYKIYQNLEMNLELDYLVNCMDNSTWKKAQTPSSFSKQDMWKAQVVFAYSF
ncbi:outer membrane homotrimeric porin [Desulfovibrio sp. UIB00]|uniref:outer membrane homotrimeric porin n=1 Tax=Desulfovibrio sp. UIB00 TaxID=2804314 RepID=UPI001F0E98C2|nr:outer membrane homotrimeric porin [Desulfovibrio sp. UIB00]MCH5146240.1 outer membrane homotrimeric porin [Desulfovibrio sp. UIB00]